MARRNNFIGTTETGQLSALGNNQQREFEFIRNLINDDGILKYFAEPSLHENQEKIDWYSRADGKVKKFQDFSDSEIKQARSEFNDLMSKLKIKSVAAKTDIDRETILNLTLLPDQDSIKKVGDQFVIINWAYKLHKKESTDGKSANFAGFIENETPDKFETNEIEISDAQALVTPSPETLEPQSQTEEAPFQLTNSPKSEEPIKEKTLKETKEINEPDLKIEKPFSSPVSNVWFWIAIFFIFLLLNVLMLKDACGVKSISFLYFC